MRASTRLVVPGPRVGVPPGGLTLRSELLAALSAAGREGVGLVLVDGPAGYGKSTLVRQWAAQDVRPFAWVRLRGNQVGTTGAAALQEPLEQARRRLTRRGEGAPSDGYVLVLDDLPPLHRSCGAWLRAYASSLPPGCQLAVVTRERLGPADPSAAGDRGCLRLGPDRLAFTPEETRDVLSRLGVPRDGASLAAVEVLEGWPAGIALTAPAAAAPRGGEDGSATGGGGWADADDPRVVEYLRREVLDRLPEDTLGFLLRVSVLDELSGAACDALLDRTGSAALLDDLDSRGLFLRRAPGRGRVRYACHPLVAAVLRSQLRHRYPQEEGELQRRATAWYAHGGEPRRAVAHAFASGDTLAAARLVVEHVDPLLDAGDVGLARDWVAGFGDGAVRAHPPLGVAAAWVWSIQGDVPRALRSALLAQRGAVEGARAEALAAGLATVRAAMAPLGVDRMLVDAALAVELQPPGTRWHATATLLLGCARLLDGDTEAAATTLGRLADPASRAGGPAAGFSSAQLALLEAGRGDPGAAARHAAAAVASGHGGRLDDLQQVLVRVACARVALDGGQPQRAVEHGAEAARLYRSRPPEGFPWFAAQAALAIGQVLLGAGDRDGARVMADLSRRHVGRLLTHGVLQGQLLQLEELLGALARPEDALTVAAPDEEPSTAELRVLELLPTHLSLADIGDRLHLSRNTVKSHVMSLHRKLSCTTRSDAVRRAQDLGWLTP